MRHEGTLLIKRSEVAELLDLADGMVAVERAFALHTEGGTVPPGILGVHAPEGGFHIKAGLLRPGGRLYFAAKTNANFPGNEARFGLPLIQGVIALCDGDNGYPLALMDSMEITTIRTGAATGLAAKYLARTDAKVATICGCGNQGRISFQALAEVRALTRGFAFDLDERKAHWLAAALSEETGVDVEAVDDLEAALHESDICVTCTPSKEAFLKPELVRPGTFIAAVGADNEDKQELEPALMASNKVVVDVLAQCAEIGELHHALEAGVITSADVHAELGEIIAGRKPGRTSESEITIFDSTGMALQDVAAAAAVYEKAVELGMGRIFDMGE